MVSRGQEGEGGAARSAGGGASEVAYERLLSQIMRGDYGERLPAERELARQLGASRATVRGALRRLSSLRLVEARQGSGVVVRPRREWSIEVLPAYLRFGGSDGRSIGAMLGDLIAIRRALLLSVLGLVAGRVAPGGLSGARAALARAWAARADGAAFTAEDFEMMRAIAESARILPAMWMLNDVAGIYLEIARAWAGGLPPLEDYVEVHERLFEALERGDREGALGTIGAYFERHDARLIGALEAFT